MQFFLLIIMMKLPKGWMIKREVRPILLVTSLVNNWETTYGIYVKRITSDRFLAVFNESILARTRKEKIFYFR